METSTKVQIRNLLLVVFSGIAVAFLFTGYMLHSYNPSGRYLVKNVLLAPETIEDLRSRGNIVVDNIEYLYFDLENKEWKKRKIAHSAYTQLYTAISEDLSIPNNPTDIATLFINPSRLILSLQSFDVDSIFQEVQFIENYYRVQLREHSVETPWAYFPHSKIQEEIIRLLGI